MKEDDSKRGIDGKPWSSNWNLIRRLLGLAWQYRLWCVGIVTIQIVLLTLGMLGLGLIGVGVDYVRFHVAEVPRLAASVSEQSVAAGSKPTVTVTVGKPTPPPKPPRWPFGLRPPSHWAPLRVISVIAVCILLFAVVRAGLNIGYVVAISQLVQGRIVVELRGKIFDKLQRLSFRFFDENISGSLINRLTGDVQHVRAFVDGVVMQSLILILSLVVYLVYMTHIHPGLTAACLATTPLLWFISAKFSRTVKPMYRKSRELFDRQVLNLKESVEGIHVVKGFARQEEEAAKFREAGRRVMDQKNAIYRKGSNFQPLITALSHVNLLVMLGYGGYLVTCYERAADAEAAVRAGLSVGQLLVFTGLLQQFSGQVANIANIVNSIQQSLIAAQRVFEILDTPVEVRSPSDAVRLPKVRGEVCFENVTMAYREGEPVLRNVSFSVKPGDCVAVLGATGSGKTTLLSLIPRFYDPAQGRVRVDGHDVRGVDLDDLRRSIGVVFQESFLFSNTVAANIAFGCPNATPEQIERAAKIAAAHDFIMQLPDGYDTILREGGVNLSGGQRQRIAIARAILLEPAVLLLDDPTAAIDPETEDEILGAMENAMAGRTTFVVAHRLSTLRRADLVMVLDRGRIVQTGTHEELMKAKGHYSSAAALQLADPESQRILDKIEMEWRAGEEPGMGA